MSFVLSDSPPILSVRRVAELLGVPQYTVRDLCRRGLLGHVRQGRRIWITRPAIERFLNGGERV